MRHLYVWQVSLQVTGPDRPNLKHCVQYRVQALSGDKVGAIEKAGLAEAEGRVAAEKQAIVAVEGQIAALRLDRDQKKELLAQARLDLAERRQKVEVLDRGLGEKERRRMQIGELLAQRQQEVDVWAEQTAGLEQEAVAGLARAAQAARTLAVAQQSVEKLRVE